MKIFLTWMEIKESVIKMSWHYSSHTSITIKVNWLHNGANGLRLHHCWCVISYGIGQRNHPLVTWNKLPKTQCREWASVVLFSHTIRSRLTSNINPFQRTHVSADKKFMVKHQMPHKYDILHEIPFFCIFIIRLLSAPSANLNGVFVSVGA